MRIFNSKFFLIPYISGMKSIIHAIVNAKPKDRSLEFVRNLKRDFARIHRLPDLPSNIELLQAYYELLKDKKITKDPQIEQLLKKRAIRSES